jgi:hypothetical protein
MHSAADRLRVLLASCALAGTLMAPAIGFGAGVSPLDATPEQRREATDHFTAGKQALSVGNLEKAVVELRASLEIVDSPNAHLELARALRDSGKSGDAWLEYGRASALATQLAPKEERYAKTAEAATDERVDVEGKLAFVAVSVTNAPDGAVMKVGGRALAPEEWKGPLLVAPGSVEVVLTDSGGTEIARRTVSASVGLTVPVSIDASPAPAPPPPGKAAADVSDDENPSSSPSTPLPAEPPPPAPSNPNKLRPYAYLLGGVGVAGMASFTVLGLLSNSTYNDLQSVCPHGCPPGKQNEIDRGKTEETIANVSLATGLAGLAVGTTLFFLSMPAPAGANVRASMFVAPSRDGAYFGLRGSL